MGSWHRPEIQLFPNAGQSWRDLPSNMLPTGESRPACKPKLKYQWGIVCKPLPFQSQKLPGRSRDKENRNALARHACTEMHFGNQLSRTITQGCERSGCDMLNAVCRHWIQGNSAPALVIPERSHFHR